MNEGLDDLELELRRLPGVIGVGFVAEAALIIELCVNGLGDTDALGERARVLAQAHHESATVVFRHTGELPAVTVE